jgi:hypothetical protein
MKAEVEVTRQASWRNVLRSTGASLLWLIILLILGGLYLTVNAKAAKAGQMVISLEARVEEDGREYAELNANLAELTSPARMAELAAAEGFRHATLSDVIFLPFDEVPEESLFRAPLPKSIQEEYKWAMSPAFTETLIDAIRRWIGLTERQ